MSAPSRRVWRSALDVSAPLSFPARSMRENLPCIFPFLRRMIWNTAWLRDEWALADVCPDVLRAREQRSKDENKEGKMAAAVDTVSLDKTFYPLYCYSYRQLLPTSMSFRTSSVHLTSFSCSPTTCTCCFPSSSTLSLALRFSRSNTYNTDT